MTSIFDPTLVVWAGLTVPPALMALTAWIGYRRSRGAPVSEVADPIGPDAPVVLATRRRAATTEDRLPERRAA